MSIFEIKAGNILWCSFPISIIGNALAQEALLPLYVRKINEPLFFMYHTDSYFS